ncbi:hypothetical protein CRG98_012240, partial [Punica granatum]
MKWAEFLFPYNGPTAYNWAHLKFVQNILACLRPIERQRASVRLGKVTETVKRRPKVSVASTSLEPATRRLVSSAWVSEPNEISLSVSFRCPSRQYVRVGFTRTWTCACLSRQKNINKKASELHRRISRSLTETEDPKLTLRSPSSLQQQRRDHRQQQCSSGELRLCIFMSRAPNHEFQEWWNKQRERNHDLFSYSSDDDPSTSGNASGSGSFGNGVGGGGYGYHAVEIRGHSSDPTVEKSRARSARQIRFFCFLKLQQIASSFASLAGASVSVLRTANRRIVASPADSSSSRLYRIIRFFLILVIVLLGFELLAYYKGWHFRPPRPPHVGSKELLDWLGLVYAWWLDIRAKYLAPPLQSLANICIILFLIQSVDRL